tara:strand:+ start:2268 stop:3050 length:783 start_codon:yes stop_codon:yes gene_type:complete
MSKFNTIGLIFIALLFITSTKAETRVAPVNEHTKCLSMHIVLNTSAGYLNETAQIAGFHLDLLNALEERTGICMDKKLMPYSRAQRSIQMGGHDGGILASSKELNESVVYIARFLVSKSTIVPKKELTLDSYQDLTKIIIGKVRGTKLNETIDNDENILFVEVFNYEQGLKMLKKGRIDAIAGNSVGLLSVFEELGMTEDVNLTGQFVLGQREVWLMLSNKSEHLDKIEKIREATLALIQENVVDNILQKYFGVNWNIDN